MAALAYGGGLRLLECLRLRIKDLDFDRAEITIRDGKGQKDRVTMVPRTLLESLRTHSAACASSMNTIWQKVTVRLPAVRPGSELSECGSGVGLAVRLHVRHREARQRTHAETLVCNASAAIRL
jgi:integrase